MITTYNTENALKTIYLGVLTDALNTQVNPLLTRIKQTSNDVWGKEIRKAKEYKDGEENSKYIQFVSTLKNLYAQVEISDRAIRLFGDCGVSAFVNLMNDEFQEVVTTAMKDLSRMLYSPERERNDLTSIGEIFDITKPIYGTERCETPLLMPIIKKVAELNDIVIEQAIDEVEDNGGRVDFIAMSRDIKYAYMEQHKNIDVMQLDGGFKALSHNGVPMVYDKYIPQGTVYLLDTSKFALHQLCDWRWLEDERGHILRKTPNKETYTATVVKYADLICESPNCQAMIKIKKD